MANQLINSEAKVLFGYAKMSSVLLQAVKLSGRPIRIVYAKASVDDSLPADGINLDELTTAKGDNDENYFDKILNWFTYSKVLT